MACEFGAMGMFVGRAEELAVLEAWWGSSAPRPAMVWGRRRVGKTALIERFADGKRMVFHTAARRPQIDELKELSARIVPVAGGSPRDLVERPYER